jgi:Fur family ferric uptake transcriptional regulator
MDSDSVATLLRKNGLRDTQPRRMVVQALLQKRRAGSPYDIQKWITVKGNTINAVTVYRVLEVFEKLGLVHRHPCNGLYTLCTIPGKKGHHGFLHCTSCGRVEEFCSTLLCMMENRIAKSARFRAKAHVSELTGLCRSCHR